MCVCVCVCVCFPSMLSSLLLSASAVTFRIRSVFFFFNIDKRQTKNYVFPFFFFTNLCVCMFVSLFLEPLPEWPRRYCCFDLLFFFPLVYLCCVSFCSFSFGFPKTDHHRSVTTAINKKGERVYCRSICACVCVCVCVCVFAWERARFALLHCSLSAFYTNGRVLRSCTSALLFV